MNTEIENLVVGVRFSKVGKVYHFEANDITDLKTGDMVVVETSRGWQLGQVAQVLVNQPKPPEGWKPIDRRATPRDLLMRQLWQQKESEVVESCKTKANDLRLVGIKIVSAEYSFDGSRLTILFSSETEEKYDLKSLRGDMQKMFAPSQVEMRQIGPRDVAKQLCGMGACGLETRCCCSFLTEFSSISIRMAKEQGISLTPSEITGMCGRLRCCLIYEYDQYVDARKSLPKRNKRVQTPQGEGKVVDIVPLREAVLVEMVDGGVREFKGSEVIVLDGEGGGKALEAAGLKEGVSDVTVTQPSELDQVLSGEEITPDRVEGVGDSGSPGPVASPGGERRHSQAPRRGGQQHDHRPRQESHSSRPGQPRPQPTGGGEAKPAQPQRGGRDQQNNPQRGRPGAQPNRSPAGQNQRREGPVQGSDKRPNQSQANRPSPERVKPSSDQSKAGQPGEQGKSNRNKRKGRRHHGRENIENGS